MRKLIAIMLVLLLCGCAAAEDTNVPEEPVADGNTEMEAVVQPPQETKLSYTVSTTTWSDEVHAEDGTLLAAYRFALPELKVVREDGTPVTEPENEAEEQALAVLSGFNEKFSKWAQAEEFQEIVSWAQEHYDMCVADNMEWYGCYTLELDCEVYQTEHMVSVSGMYYSYTGGAHPNTWTLSWNYDLEMGEFFSPELLGEGTELQDAVTAEIIRQAQIPMEDGYVPVEMYWEDYEEIIANWPCYAVTFRDGGMDVVFSAYELAPYAAGPQEFHLSYEFLEPYLSEQGKVLLGLEEN
jgi:hypothetical protein